MRDSIEEELLDETVEKVQSDDQYEDAFGMSATMFFAKIKGLKPFAKQVGLGGTIRAVKHAFMATIVETNIKLKNQQEMQLSHLISEIIDHHAIIRGGIIKKQSEELIQKSEENKDGRQEEK